MQCIDRPYRTQHLGAEPPRGVPIRSGWHARVQLVGGYPPQARGQSSKDASVSVSIEVSQGGESSPSALGLASAGAEPGSKRGSKPGAKLGTPTPSSSAVPSSSGSGAPSG